MKRLICVICLLLGLLYSFVAAQTISGEITANETWSGTVIVKGDVIVLKGKLTITPGTVVLFDTINGNVVYGTTAQICLVVKDSGAISALGTVDSPVVFNSNSPNPIAGNWGRILIDDLINDSLTMFNYCLIKNCRNGISIENIGGAIEPSSIRIEHCTVESTSSSGIYASQKSSIQINGCTIRNCKGNAGIFFDGTATISITGTYVYNIGCGILLSGRDTMMAATINHVTIFNINSSFTTSPSMWTGYGVFTTNTTSGLELHNSIICKTQINGLIDLGSWTIHEDYDCWYNNGVSPIYNSVIGPHSFQLNPLFLNDTTFDLRLDSLNSPCANTANDGDNIGAWQMGDDWPPYLLPVTLSSFTGGLSNNSTILYWDTESEQDNLGFNVLRSESENGTFIQTNSLLIPGAGTTAMPQNYFYADKDVQRTYFYKLEQVDIGGHKSYSKVICVQYMTTSISNNITKSVNLNRNDVITFDLGGRVIKPNRSGIYFKKVNGSLVKLLIIR